MLSKTSRAQFIRQRFYALGMRASLAAVPALVASSRSEVSQTIHSYSDRNRTDDSILDESVELDSLSRVEQALETSPTGWRSSDSDTNLSRTERARLQREVATLRGSLALRAAVAAVPLLLTA